jgi:hypothetical protein
VSALAIGILVASSVIVPVLVAIIYSARYLRTISRHRAESALWLELSADDPDAGPGRAKASLTKPSSRIRTDATVLELIRPRRRMTTPGAHHNALAVVQLRLQYPARTGEERETVVSTLIEEALLPDFEAGATVGIIYNRGDPGRVAMDRERRALESGGSH